MLAFYSDDPSSNPAGDSRFYSLNLFEKQQTEARDGPFKNITIRYEG